MRRWVLGLMIGALVAACDEDGTGPGPDLCAIEALPLSGDPDGPTITDVELEVQASGIVATATATDPQGGENLRDVLQTFSLFPDENCMGTPRTLQDDLVDVGVEETFGTIVDAQVDAALYQQIVSAVSWPVEVDFVDLDLNRTTGRVLARISR